MKSFFSTLLTFLNISIMYFVFNSTVAADNLVDPKLTEKWQAVKTVDTTGHVPSDAIVLFDGESTDNWQHVDGSKVKWAVKDGVLTVMPGSKDIISTESFCDIQLHLEWKSPDKIAGKTGQGDGNSGVFLQSRYEIQILNAYQNETYANGQVCSVYKQSIPLVNASRPRNEWQTYDIIFKAPKFDDNGKLMSKAHVTVLHNGVLIQNHVEILGATTYRGQPQCRFPRVNPGYLLLQLHSELI